MDHHIQGLRNLKEISFLEQKNRDKLMNLFKSFREIEDIVDGIRVVCSLLEQIFTINAYLSLLTSTHRNIAANVKVFGRSEL